MQGWEEGERRARSLPPGSTPLAQDLEGPGGSHLRSGLPTAPSPSQGPLLCPPCFHTPPRPQATVHSLRLSQGCQIGQISVMLKNWPISRQGTLTGAGSRVCCLPQMCQEGWREGAPGLPRDASNVQGTVSRQCVCTRVRARVCMALVYARLTAGGFHNITTYLRGRSCKYSHVTDEENEAQRQKGLGQGGSVCIRERTYVWREIPLASMEPPSWVSQ